MISTGLTTNEPMGEDHAAYDVVTSSGSMSAVRPRGRKPEQKGLSRAWPFVPDRILQTALDVTNEFATLC